MPKYAFILEDFTIPSPGQQLLDRFLVGYPKEGQFHRPSGAEIFLSTNSPMNEAIEARVKDFGLKLASVEEAANAADGLVLAWKGEGENPNPDLLNRALTSAKPGTCVFVHGLLSTAEAAAREAAKRAADRNLRLCAGTSLRSTYRLPELELPSHANVREALIAVPGSSPISEFHGLEGLLPLIESRANPSPFRLYRQVRGPEVWQSGMVSRDLLGAAMSRSNNIQGDPQKDGRTQDVVGLRLVEKLAKDPKAWFLQDEKGVRAVILGVEGITTDINFAVRTPSKIFSAQLYRPPAPMQEQFSRLAGVLENFFTTKKEPWPLEGAIQISSLLAQMRKSSPA